ncbi:hypothetical protein [Parasphingorhabdus sp.]|uniref:hypothetical protein n=1 Tax=Parasphingorhabdus sp. TaxID=2709688 RepID=UPI003C787613
MTHHLPLDAASGTSLAIGRAVVHGAMRRERLSAALARATLDGLGLGRDEYLIIPHLIMAESLRYGESGTRYASAVSKRLRNCLEKAELDPVRGALGGHPLRFSSKVKLALWLIAEYGRGTSALPSAIRLVTGTPTISLWWQRELLGDAPLLVQIAATLFARKMLGGWIGNLSDREIETVTRSVATSFGSDAVVAAAYDRSGSRPDLSLRSGATRWSQSSQPQSIAGTPDDVSLLPPPIRSAIANDPALRTLDSKRQMLAATILFLAFFPAASRTRPLRDFARKFLTAIGNDRLEATAPRSDVGQGPGLPISKKAPLAFADKPETTDYDKLAGNGSPKTERPLDVHPNPNRDNPPPVSALVDNEPDAETAAVRQRSDVRSDGVVDLDRFAVDETRFDSNYCGLMFLVNPLIRYGFCKDFGLFADDAMDLSPFATIKALGCHWFGNKFRADPIYGLLSQSRHPPRRNKHFMLPRPQMFDIADSELKLVRDRRYFTLWHADGVPVLDLPATKARGHFRVAANLPGIAKLPGRCVRQQKGFRLPRSSARRWTAALARLMEWQLRSAIVRQPLQVEQLCLAGSIVIREGAISIEMALDDLPFGVRIAGLDRDPGWLVREGRSLAFKFL